MLPIERARTLEEIRNYAALWKRYEISLRSRNPTAYAETFSVIRDYEKLSAVLYRVRAAFPLTDPFRRSVEDALTNASHQLLETRKEKKQPPLYPQWVRRYRSVWRENLSLFLLTVIVAVAATLVSWYVTYQEPEFVAAFVEQSTIEQVLEDFRWFETIEHNPLSAGIGIAWNNIRVSFNAFLGGIVLGLGGMYILLFNFYMFGSLLAFCTVNDFDALGRFVLGHGPLELTIIIASVFTSFIYGRVFFMRPYALFGRRFVVATSDAWCLVVGILPWLVVAASVEAFISPSPDIPLSFKLTIGLTVTAAFWLWTFWRD